MNIVGIVIGGLFVTVITIILAVVAFGPFVLAELEEHAKRDQEKAE